MTANNNNSSNLLDEFRSSSLSPPLLQSLLHRLLSHPKILNGFVDVLKLPPVQRTLGQLEDDKRAALVRTVELFAFGTVKEYYDMRETGVGVWTLNDAQLEKLRMLSVATVARDRIEKFRSSEDRGGASSSSSFGGDVEMADTAPKRQQPKKKKKDKRGNGDGGGMLSISYSHLASELRIPEDGEPYDEKSMRTLEDLLIQCICSDIIAAKLDQSSRSLRVEPHVSLTHESPGGGGVGSKGSKKDGVSEGGVYGSVFSRDLKTSTEESTNAEVSRLISTLQQFLKQSNTLLSTLDHSSKATFSDRKEDEIRWKEVKKELEESPSKLREAASAAGGGQGGGMGMGSAKMGGGDPMEVVDMRRQVKRSKGGHSMMMGGGGGRFG